MNTKLYLIFLISLISYSPNIVLAQCSPEDPDFDNDGICDALDICPNTPSNIDANNDGICDAEVCKIEHETSFENGSNGWTSGNGSYAFIIDAEDYAGSGSHAYRIYYNNPQYSFIKSSVFDFSGKTEVSFRFSFNTQNYSAGQMITLFRSNDGGVNYEILKQYIYGQDFNANNQLMVDSVYLSSPYSSNTVFKIQGGSIGYVYIDDIKIGSCFSCDGLGDANNNEICDCEVGEPSPDSDNDGIEDNCDICPNSPDNVDENNDGICDLDACKIDQATSFENGSDFWTAGHSSYAVIVNANNYAGSGTNAYRIYYNYPQYSYIESPEFDFSNKTAASFRFSYNTQSYSNGQAITLYRSNDGGANYEVLKQYIYGQDFNGNNQLNSDSVYLPPPYSTNTVFKIQGGSGGYVYIDDVAIRSCISCDGSSDQNNNGICDCEMGEPSNDTDGDGIEDNCDICPNSPSNLDADNDGKCDAEACKADQETSFENGTDFWIAGHGSYAAIVNAGNYAGNGVNAFRIYYNYPQYSYIQSPEFDFSEKTEVSFRFSFNTQNYSNGQKVILFRSNDGGGNYEILKQYTYGEDFSSNNQLVIDSIYLLPPYSANTVFKIQGGSGGYVYIDDIAVRSCISCPGTSDENNDLNNNGICDCTVGEPSPDTDGDGVENYCDICPNTPSNLDVNDDGICDAEACKSDQQTSFENGTDFWIAGHGSYASIVNAGGYAGEGVNAYRIYYNYPQYSYIQSPEFDFSEKTEVSFHFSFNTQSYSNGQIISLLRSDDGGDNFIIAKQFIYGEDFSSNNQLNIAQVYLSAPYSANTIFRIQGGSTGYVYIDDIDIKSCISCNGIGDANNNGVCDCAMNEPSPDTDGDGIEDNCDICPYTSSNLDANNDGICDSESCKVENSTDFETVNGIWISHGNYAGLNTSSSYSKSGSRSFYIRYNQAGSYLESLPKDFSEKTELELNFSFYTRSLTTGDYFVVEISMDNGENYQLVKQYNYGLEISQNNIYFDEGLTIVEDFTNQTIIRFRSVMNSTSKYVYIDDVSLGSCVFCNGLGDANNNGICDCALDEPSEDTDGDGIEDNCDVCPDSPSNVDANNDGVCDSEVCKIENATDFEELNGIWTQFGNYAALNTSSSYSKSGNKSFYIRYNQEGSYLHSVPLALAGKTELSLDFSFYTRSLTTGDYFVVEISMDNGEHYELLKQYNYGLEISQNNIYIDEGLTIVEDFTDQTIIRFRSVMNSTSKYVYIDDVSLGSCVFCNGLGDANNNGICDCALDEPSEDTDGDGIEDTCDVCPDSPSNVDANNDGICDSEVCKIENATDFEELNGIWTQFGNYAALNTSSSYSKSGNKSFYIRYNQEGSYLHSVPLALAGKTELSLDFSFYTRSLTTGDYFVVEISMDNGEHYELLKQYNYGLEISQNNIYFDEGLTIVEDFTDQTIIRFRSVMNSTSKYVYLDDVSLGSCVFCNSLGDANNNGICDCVLDEPSEDTDGDGIEDNCDVCPDSPSNVDANNDGVCDSEVCKIENATDFEELNGIWTQFGNYAALNTSSSYSKSGNRSFYIRYNQEGSYLHSVPLALAGKTELSLDFSFYTRSLTTGDYFVVEISMDNGEHYELLKQYNYGLEISQNNIYIDEGLTIVEDFTDQTIIRFRSVMNSTSKYVYLDDVSLGSCVFCNGLGDANNNGICDCALDEPSEDTDGDGIEDTCDVCPDSPSNVDANNDGVCDSEVCKIENATDFEELNGIWTQFGNYAALNTSSSYSKSGNRSFYIRYNQEGSYLHSVPLDLVGKTELSLDFSFYARSLTTGDYFVVEISMDNGENYQLVKQYNYGLEIPQNNIYFDEGLTIVEDFTNQTIIRFRSVMNSTSKYVYIDDVSLGSCVFCNGLGDANNNGICDCALDEPSEDTDGDGIEDNCDVCPDSPSNVDANNDGICDSESCKTENATDFETVNGIWTKYGNYAALNTSSSYSKSGNKSFYIRYNQSGSYLESLSKDFSGKTELELNFSFYGRSLTTGDYFVVEISMDNGENYQLLKQYNYGLEIPQNDVYFEEELIIVEDFTAETILRFRSVLNSTSKYVYLDDISLSSCIFCNGLGDANNNGVCDCELDAPSEDTDGDGIEDTCDVCPYTPSNLDENNDGICDSESCKTENATDFETVNGIWTKYGNYAGLNTSASYSKSGNKSFYIRYNQSGSYLESLSKDFSDKTELGLDFSFYTRSLTTGDYFVVEISMDNGENYEVVKQYNYGLEIPQNDVYFEEELIIVEDFTAETIIRFRSILNSTSKYVYLDDVSLGSCVFCNGLGDANNNGVCDCELDAPSEDTDGDGIEDTCDVCPYTPSNLDENNDGICDSESCKTENATDFETVNGIWTKYGNYAGLNTSASYSKSGNKSFYIRYNQSGSYLESLSKDFSDKTELGLDFSFYTQSLGTGDYFVVEISMDNGENYEVVKQYNYGLEIPQNNVYFEEELIIVEDFTNQTILRFRSVLNSTSKYVYLDDVSLSSCIFCNGLGDGNNNGVCDCELDAPSEDTDGDGIEDTCDVCPYTPSNLDENNDGICDSESCKTENATDFETVNGIWTKYGNYAGLNTSASYSKSGNKSFYIRYNQSGSYLESLSKDFSDKTELGLDFSFYTRSLTTGDYFVVEISMDNGENYQLLKQYNYGLEIPQNDVYFEEELIIVEDFTAETILRFRSILNSTSKYVYLDDVSLSSCIFCNGLGDANNNGVCDCELDAPSEDTDGDGIEDNCDVCPNSASNIDLDNDGVCDSETCKTENETDFEVERGIWQSNGNYAALNSSATYAKSGSKSYYLNYNQVGSYLETVVMDLSEKTEIGLSFSFNGRSLSTGDYFTVEISTDNGNTFEVVKQYNYGVEILQNAAFFDDQLVIVTNFSAQTIIRLRSFLSSTSKYVYLDDISLTSCEDCNGLGDPNQNGECDCDDNFQDDDNDGVCNGEDVCVSIPDSLIGTACDDGNPCTVDDIYTLNCLCEGTLLPDSDQDGVCDAQDQCPGFNDELDIDDDGIPYCIDDCIDVNENGICDDVDPDPITDKLKVHFTHKRGFYDNTFELSLIANDPNAIIRYHLGANPATPTVSSGQIYDSSITIEKANDPAHLATNAIQTIKVIAYTPDATTKVYTHSYLFFDPQNIDVVVVSSGAYPVADGDQANISFEFLPHKNSSLDDVQEYAGIRHKDQASYGWKNSPKLYFRSEYGAGTLKADLFSDSYDKDDPQVIQPAEKFDQLYLRYLHHDDHNIRQILTTDLHIKAGSIAPHSKYVLYYYLGQVRGVRQMKERPEAGFMKTYFGGEKDDYEAFGAHASIKTPNTTVLSNYDSLFNYYYDLHNIVTFNYINNVGGDVQNNQIRSANPIVPITPEGAKFMYWDWDTDFVRGKYNGFHDFTRVFQYLKNDIEFVSDYSDKFHCLCENDGVLTPTNWMEVQDSLLQVRDNAYDLITNYNAYSASSPIAWGSGIYIPSLQSLTNAHNSYLAGLKSNNLLRTEAVIFNKYGGDIDTSFNIELTNPNNYGEIYYTTDGSDPRLKGGDLNPEAILYDGPFSFPAGIYTIKARVYDPNNNDQYKRWSRMCPRTFYLEQNYSDLVINEIHYNPSDSIFFNPALNAMDTIDGKNFEFIELKNIGQDPINLFGSEFTKGVDLLIDSLIIVPPNGFVVFAEDANWFEAKYGFAPDGVYGGQLDNGGEKINIKNVDGYFIDTVRYNNENPWDEAPNENNYTLELLHASLDNSDPLNWFRSDEPWGTPRAENSRTCAQTDYNIVINEINYNSNNDELDPGNWVELHNPTPEEIDLSGWTFYDNGDKFILPQGTTLPDGEFLLLVENEDDFASSFPNVEANKIIGEFPFGLSKKGERISLFDQNKCLVDYVIYDDKNPWAEAPDGEGPTLSLLEPLLDNALAESWESSAEMNAAFTHGSPGVSNFCIAGQPCDDNDPTTVNDLYDEDCSCVGESTRLFAKILLEGFYQPQNNNMHTVLNNKNLIPLSQPFNIAPWNYDSVIVVNSIPDNVVDWILLISRDNEGDVLDQKVGFINQDGELLHVDGTLGIPIISGKGNKFSIHHRSHLAILSASTYEGDNYDFTTSANQAEGNGQLKLVDGKYMMHAGDYDGNGIINSVDFNGWKILGAIINQYLSIDGDGNGIMNSLDYNLWTNNKSKVGHPIIRY